MAVKLKAEYANACVEQDGGGWIVRGNLRIDPAPEAGLHTNREVLSPMCSGCIWIKKAKCQTGMVATGIQLSTTVTNHSTCSALLREEPTQGLRCMSGGRYNIAAH